MINYKPNEREKGRFFPTGKNINLNKSFKFLFRIPRDYSSEIHRNLRNSDMK